MGGVHDLSIYALVPSIELVKSYTGSVQESDQPALVQVVNDVSEQVEDFCERKFITRTWDVRLSGTDSQRLPLPHYPVQSITSCYTDVDDTVDIPLTELIHNVGNPEAGFLHAKGGYGFTRGDRNIHLVYVTAYMHNPTAQNITDGFLQIPHALIGVTLRLAARFWKRRKNLGDEVIEQEFGGVTRRFLEQELTKQDRQVLAGYKRMNGAWAIR